MGIVCGAAWGSHTLLDWVGADDNPPLGIQALWPFSKEWFMADWSLFRGTERRDPLSWPSIVKNAKAALQEIAILGTLAVVVWRVREKRERAEGRGRRAEGGGQIAGS